MSPDQQVVSDVWDYAAETGNGFEHVLRWMRAVKSLATLEKLKAGLDDFPKDDEIDLVALAGILDPIEEPDPSPDWLLSQMPDDVRQRLDDAGCTYAKLKERDSGLWELEGILLLSPRYPNLQE